MLGAYRRPISSYVSGEGIEVAGAKVGESPSRYHRSRSGALIQNCSHYRSKCEVGGDKHP